MLDHRGNLQCQFFPGFFNGDSFREGIFSTPALADLDRNDGGRLEIVFGGWDAYVTVLHDDCTTYWNYFTRDTIWSSKPSQKSWREPDGFIATAIANRKSWR